MANVETQKIKEAADTLSRSIPVFQHALKGLLDVSSELDRRPLSVLPSASGHYDAQLNRFGSRLVEVLDEFIEDDKGFVAFLQQFADNMKHVAGDYDQIESENTQHMSNLTQRLDGGV